MSAMATNWKHICVRLGVNGKQFALLLSICVVAISILGVKAVAGGPKKSSASPLKAAPVVPTPPPAPTAVKAIAFTLQSWPARDPFKGSGSQITGHGSGAMVTGPKSLKLGATMDNQFAIINGKTLKEGQSLTDPANGAAYRLVEVQPRAAILEADGQRFQIAFD